MASDKTHRTWAGQMTARIAGLAFAASLLAGCVTPGNPGVTHGDAANDPIEPFNRLVFAANDAFDTVALRPATVVYRDWVPSPVQQAVHNFLGHLRLPVVLANDLFQQEWERAETSLARFVLNTMALGVFDLASAEGYLPHEEDFGQTLAVHGTDSGPYIVLPLFGPSNARDTTGRVVDFFLDPLSYYAWRHEESTITYARGGATAIDTRHGNLEATDQLRASSVDYYATLRSAYAQRRKMMILNGREAVEGDEAEPNPFDSFEKEGQS